MQEIYLGSSMIQSIPNVARIRVWTLVSPDQRLTNDTQQPNKNKRRQTSSNATLIIRFYRLFREGRTAHNGALAGLSKQNRILQFAPIQLIWNGCF
jgi:hypothetical protein